jgi:hypothetical protein
MARYLCVAVVFIVIVLEFSEGRRHTNQDYNCQDPPETGHCRAMITRWNYDSQNGTCLEFVWGGCGGNGNKFPSRSVCERHCNRPQRSRRVCGEFRCRKRCEFGYTRDENNCTLCACVSNPGAVAPSGECPQIECPVSCPNGYQLDENGCSTCFCRPSVQHHVVARSVTCPPVCLMHCRYGNKQDENRCPICQCRTKEEVCGATQCRMACPNGAFKQDPKGCDLCECLNTSDSTRPTRRPHDGSHGGHQAGHHGSHHGGHQGGHGSRHGGHHGGHHGRRTTTANPGNAAQLPADSDEAPAQLPGSTVSCRAIRCSLNCRGKGYAKDSFGCNICACGSGRPSPTGRPTRTWPSRNRATTPSPASANCDNRPMCMMFCENGFKRGADGCDVCTCN